MILRWGGATRPESIVPAAGGGARSVGDEGPKPRPPSLKGKAERTKKAATAGQSVFSSFPSSAWDRRSCEAPLRGRPSGRKQSFKTGPFPSRAWERGKERGGGAGLFSWRF